MNEEIKELLDDLKNKDCYINNETILKFDEASLLLDYITNLQQENEQLQNQLQQKDNIIKDIKAQLDYLETYSSKEDVFEDMKRRLDKIEKIIDKENK